MVLQEIKVLGSNKNIQLSKNNFVVVNIFNRIEEEEKEFV